MNEIFNYFINYITLPTDPVTTWILSTILAMFSMICTHSLVSDMYKDGLKGKFFGHLLWIFLAAVMDCFLLVIIKIMMDVDTFVSTNWTIIVWVIGLILGPLFVVNLLFFIKNKLNHPIEEISSGNKKTKQSKPKSIAEKYVQEMNRKNKK